MKKKYRVNRKFLEILLKSYTDENIDEFFIICEEDGFTMIETKNNIAEKILYKFENECIRI